MMDSIRSEQKIDCMPSISRESWYTSDQPALVNKYPVEVGEDHQVHSKYAYWWCRNHFDIWSPETCILISNYDHYENRKTDMNINWRGYTTNPSRELYKLSTHLQIRKANESPPQLTIPSSHHSHRYRMSWVSMTTLWASLASYIHTV